MRQSPSVDRFRHTDQIRRDEADATVILTTLKTAEGLILEHRLMWRKAESAFEIQTRFVNGSSQPVTIQMLSSFSLSGITPFHSADAPGRLRVHRFRSGWSAEGRLESCAVEDLHLERSWSGAA